VLVASAIASLYDTTAQVGEHASDGAKEISDVCIGLANALVDDQLQGPSASHSRAEVLTIVPVWLASLVNML